jgi:hypothetical protein
MSSERHSASPLPLPLRKLPELARVAGLAELIADAGVSPALRDAMEHELVLLATREASAQTPWKAFVGVLRGISVPALEHRVSRDAIAALVSHWGWLSTDAKKAVRTLPPERVSEAISQAQSGSRTQREHIAAALRDFAAPSLWTWLNHFIRDHDASVRERASDSLASLAAVYADSPRESASLCRVAALTLAESTPDPDVRRNAAACILALASLSTFRAKAMQPLLVRRDVIGPLQTSLRFSPLPHAAARSVEWLLSPPFETSCIDRLVRLESATERSLVFDRWHLMARPARAAKLAQLRSNKAAKAELSRTQSAQSNDAAEPRGILAIDAGASTFSESTQIGAAATARILKIEAPVREAFASAVLTAPEAVVRLAARQIAPTHTLADFAFDVHPAVARGAAIRWLDAWKAGERFTRAAAMGVPPEYTLRQLTRSHHEGVRAMALDTQSRTKRIDVSVSELRQGLRVTASASQQQAALAEVSRRDLARACSASVISLAASPDVDPRARATAMGLLGRLRDQESLQVLLSTVEPACARDLEPRVVANAIDAVNRRAHKDEPAIVLSRMPVVEPKDAAAHQRVRASSIRLLSTLGTDPAAVGETTLEMLRDPRPAHRLSGAWLVGRIANASVEAKAKAAWAVELQHLATRADDRATRARAAQSLAQLTDSREQPNQLTTALEAA